jgi:hypothetical protein
VAAPALREADRGDSSEFVAIPRYFARGGAARLDP